MYDTFTPTPTPTHLQQQTGSSVVVKTTAKIALTFKRSILHKHSTTAPTALSYMHKHLFKFKVVIDVYPDDGELQFYPFLTWIESLYDNRPLQSDFKTCDVHARELASAIHAKYPTRTVCVEVWEEASDFGAIVTLEPIDMVSMD